MARLPYCGNVYVQRAPALHQTMCQACFDVPEYLRNRRGVGLFPLGCRFSIRIV